MTPPAGVDLWAPAADLGCAGAPDVATLGANEVCSIREQRAAMTQIRLLVALRENQGPHYNAGEVISVPEPKAALWIAKGWAEPVTAPVPDTARPVPEKAPDGPPRDTQIKRPPVKK